MAEQNQDGIYTVNTPCLMAHPNVIEPKAFKGPNGKPKGEPKYSASFVFKADHADLAALKAKVLEVAKAKWPGRNIVEDAKNGIIKLPFTSGDKIADKRVAKLKAAGKEDDKRGDFQRGATVFKSSSQYPPGLGVVSNGTIVDVTSDNKAVHKGAFYFGTQALPRFNFKAYDKIDEDGKDGVTAYIDMVVSLNKGDRLSGRQSTAEAFKGVAGMASTEDPTGGDSLDDGEAF